MKILVIQQKMIGDVLTSSILFEALRLKYPNAQLDYLINEHTFPVVENNPFIDNFIFFTKKEETSKKALFKFSLAIRKQNYDVIIDVYSKLSSNIITAFSKAKTKISYRKSYSKSIYTHNINLIKTGSNLAINNRLNLLTPLDIDSNTIQPIIYLKEEEILQADIFLKNNGLQTNTPIYMISVLGSGPNKTYPFNYMAKVVDLIVSETKGQILFNYIPSQEKEAKDIFNLCKKTTQNNIFFNVYGNSLREFLAISSHCTALIGNEGGAINMAKALSIPTFAIFSPWIKKNAWNLFENDTNVCIHLKDYKPTLYNSTEKNYKKESSDYYLQLTPDLFSKELKTFLGNLG